MPNPAHFFTFEEKIARAEEALSSGDTACALAIGDALLKDNLTNPAAWALIEKAWLQQGAMMKSFVASSLALGRLPFNKDPHSALRILATCFVRGGLRCPVYGRLAKLAEELEAWELARFAYQGLVRLAPEKPAYVLALGHVYLRLHAFAAALDCADSLIKTKRYALEGERLAREILVTQATQG